MRRWRRQVAPGPGLVGCMFKSIAGSRAMVAIADLKAHDSRSAPPPQRDTDRDCEQQGSRGSEGRGMRGQLPDTIDPVRFTVGDPALISNAQGIKCRSRWRRDVVRVGAHAPNRINSCVAYRRTARTEIGPLKFAYNDNAMIP